MSSTEFEISGDIYKVNGKKVTVREYCKVAGEQINKLQSKLAAALAKNAELEQQLKAMTIERDCWITNAKALQAGYNVLDARIRELTGTRPPSTGAQENQDVNNA